MAPARDPSAAGRPSDPRRWARAGSATTGSPSGMDHGARSLGSARSSAQRRRTSPPCDAPPVRADGHQPVPSMLGSAPTEELLDRVLRRDRVDRQPGPEFQARRSRAGAGGSPSASGRSRRPVRAAARCGGRGCRAGRRGSPRAGTGPGGALPRWPPRRASSRARNRPRGGAARSRPRTRSARRTGRRPRSRRPPRRAGPGRRDSSRTSRQNGHSPSRMTNRAAPPISSAIRCGIWGRS